MRKIKVFMYTIIAKILMAGLEKWEYENNEIASARNDEMFGNDEEGQHGR